MDTFTHTVYSIYYKYNIFHFNVKFIDLNRTIFLIVSSVIATCCLLCCLLVLIGKWTQPKRLMTILYEQKPSMKDARVGKLYWCLWENESTATIETQDTLKKVPGGKRRSVHRVMEAL